jgi:subtilisin family serine protease
MREEQRASYETLELVRLAPLMERTRGRPEIVVALIDGPVAPGIPALPTERFRVAPGVANAGCAAPDSVACAHGTFVAAMFAAEPSSPAPAICPGCTLLLRPIFTEGTAGADWMPSASPEELAEALTACVEAGARVVNLSLGITRSSARGERALGMALDVAARRGAVVVVAAGNQGLVGASPLTRHPWVIPVSACDLSGAPLGFTNLGSSIGRRGLAAPGVGVTSLGPDGQPTVAAGTSIAAPFVAGTTALLWSERPDAPSAAIKEAILRPHAGRRPGIVPPLLDAWGAHESFQRARW